MEALGLRYKLLWDVFGRYKKFVKLQLQRTTALRRSTNPQRESNLKLHVIISEMFEHLQLECIAAFVISKVPSLRTGGVGFKVQVAPERVWSRWV